MTDKSGNIILIGMIVGTVVGALGGYFLPNVFGALGVVGTLFINALKLVVIPLIVSSVIIGVTSLGDIRRLGRTAGKTVAYYFSTTMLSLIVGLILVNILRPGVGVEPLDTAVPDVVEKAQGRGIEDIFLSLIPSNLVGAAADGEILGLILFSLVFGGVLTTMGRRADVLIGFFDGINQAMMKLVHLIIYAAPIGVLALIGSIVAEKRDELTELVSSLGMYSLTVIIGLAIHAFVTLPLLLKYLGGRSPWEFGTNLGKVFMTAFTTASSSATLPITMEELEEKNKVDPKAVSFVTPLGATINMDGTALYEAVAAVFIAQVFGIDLTLTDQLLIFITATMVSVGAAGIPHAGTVMMVFVLTAVNLPIEGIGLIWAVDWFLDRCRTTVNVWGDSVGTAVIANTAELKEPTPSPTA